MKSQLFNTNNTLAFKSIIISLVILMSCSCLTLEAQRHCWTSVGSAGTVDEADLNVIALSSNTAAVKPTTNAATVDIRFNIVATEGLFGGECSAKTLAVRYADNGPSAQVIVRLHSLNIVSGVTNVLAELNSNTSLLQMWLRRDLCHLPENSILKRMCIT